ncbi:radical SAM protein [Staphylococcus felis]|nr:radical SAM protein [Staphylococcus felis]
MEGILEMDKYLYFNDNSRLHQLPNGGVIEVKNGRLDDEVFDFEYLDLNSSAFEACTYFDGSKTAPDILKEMCSKYNCDINEHLEWYSNLINRLYKKGLIDFVDYPIKKKLNVSGSTDYITPLHAVFEITHKCNLKCEHCYLESSPFIQDTLSLEEFKKIATTMYENGILTCEITGGEVFVHPNAKEILEFALNKFKKVGILTNGTLLKQDILDLLIKYKKKIVVGISLDSICAEKHDSFRGKKSAFHQTCRTINKLSENGLFVRVGMSIYEDNMWEIDDMAKLVRVLGASAFSYNWIDDFGRGKTMDQLKLNKLDDLSFAEFEVEVVKNNSDIIPLVPITKNQANNCGAGWRSIVMDPNGNIRPCALFPKEFVIGNLKEQTYEEVFSSEIVNRLYLLQSPQKSSFCSDKCGFKDYCAGCYLKGLNTNKNHRNSHCGWIKGEKLESLVEKI